MWRSSFFVVALLTLSACSTNEINSSFYPYEFNKELAAKPIKQIMIAPINFKKPSRHYLTSHEASIDEIVKSNLNDAGYKVLPNKSFQSIWKKAQMQFGSTYNPSTGELTDAFQPAIESTLATVFAQNPNLDAILFTDLIEIPVLYKKGKKRYAEWSGVQRKVKVEGLDDALADDFNWAQPVDGITITIYVFNRDLQLVQHSEGGIQIAEALKMSNKTGQFLRRNDLLSNDKEITEGIKLALHPFIIMKDYPAKTTE